MKRLYAPPAGSSARHGWDKCLDLDPVARKQALATVIHRLDDPGYKPWADGWLDAWDTFGMATHDEIARRGDGTHGAIKTAVSGLPGNDETRIMSLTELKKDVGVDHSKNATEDISMDKQARLEELRMKLAAPDYKTYVEKKRNEGKKPLDRKEWERRVLQTGPANQKKDDEAPKAEVAPVKVPKDLGGIMQQYQNGGDIFGQVGSHATGGKAIGSDKVEEAMSKAQEYLEEAKAGKNGWGKTEVKELNKVIKGLSGLLPKKEVKKPEAKKAPTKKHPPAVQAVVEKHDLEDSDVDEVKAFKKAKPRNPKVKKTDAQLMQDFLAKAKPETKERMKGVSPAEFMKMLGAIMDDAEGGGEGGASGGKKARLEVLRSLMAARPRAPQPIDLPKLAMMLAGQLSAFHPGIDGALGLDLRDRGLVLKADYKSIPAVLEYTYGSETKIVIQIFPTGKIEVSGKVRDKAIQAEFQYRPEGMMTAGTVSHILHFIEAANPEPTFVYEVVGTGPSGRMVFPTKEDLLRKFPAYGVETNSSVRKELQGQPHLKELTGPMWGGRKGDVAVIRYETNAFYRDMSRNASGGPNSNGSNWKEEPNPHRWIWTGKGASWLKEPVTFTVLEIPGPGTMKLYKLQLICDFGKFEHILPFQWKTPQEAFKMAAKWFKPMASEGMAGMDLTREWKKVPTGNDSSLRMALTKLAHDNPEMRKHLVPVLRKTATLAPLTGRKWTVDVPEKLDRLTRVVRPEHRKLLNSVINVLSSEEELPSEKDIGTLFDYLKGTPASNKSDQNARDAAVDSLKELKNHLQGKTATEFPTEDALKKYLKEHPKADLSQHSVKKPSVNPDKQKKLDDFISGLKGKKEQVEKEDSDKAQRAKSDKQKKLDDFISGLKGKKQDTEDEDKAREKNRRPEDKAEKKATMNKQAGYTHYWEVLRTFTPEEWTKIVGFAKQIVAKAVRDKIVIAGPTGTGAPQFTGKWISLNGDSSTDSDYETFHFTRTADHSFCKTAQRPYDAIVVSILAMVKQVAPEAIEVRSDGGPSAIKRIYG